jgi:hypothetical protein
MIETIRKRGRSSLTIGVAAVLLVGVGCAPSTSGGKRGQGSTHQASEVYAAVIRQLVMRDDTFGGSNPHFKRVFILDAAVPGAGDPNRNLERPSDDKPLSSEVKHEMLRLLKDLPRVKFVSRRASVISHGTAGDPLGRVIHGGVLITLGPIERTPDGVQVPNNLWVSGLAGQWLTYVLEERGSDWQISGTTGTAAIS